MAIQLCPVDTANVHPRNILGSSSSFDRERLSPFGSLRSRRGGNSARQYWAQVSSTKASITTTPILVG